MRLAEQINRFRTDDCVYPAGGTLGPRVQTSLQLFYVYSGHCHVFVDGVERHIGAGEMTLLLPGHVEQFRFALAETTHHGFCSALNAVLSEKQRRDYRRLTAVYPLSAKIRELTDWAKTVTVGTDLPSSRLYQQIGQLLFYEFFRIAGWPEEQTPLPEAVIRSRMLMDTQYDTALDLKRIAQAACVTPTHLIRLFKQYLDVTPVEYLWRTRTENGRRLLTETGLSISEIAYRCGFGAPYHFSRRFKGLYGKTPRTFRQSEWFKKGCS